MKQENIQILSCKVGKVVRIDYFDKTDGRNHSIEDEEAVHPHLRRALLDLQDDFAGAFYTLGHSKEKFVPNGFTVTEKDGIFFLTIAGKFETSHEDTINITSGKIAMEDDPTDDLVVKLNALRHELWEYFWNDKNAQAKLPFDEEKKQEVEEENAVLKD